MHKAAHSRGSFHMFALMVFLMLAMMAFLMLALMVFLMLLFRMSKPTIAALNLIPVQFVLFHCSVAFVLLLRDVAILFDSFKTASQF